MRRSPTSTFGLAIVLILSLASCGGGGDAGDDDSGEQLAETEAESAEPNIDGTTAAEITSVDTLVLGIVPMQDRERTEENAEELARQLSEELGGFPVESDVFDTYSAALEGMQINEIHLLMSGPLRMAQAEEEMGGTPILQSVRNGDNVHVAQWFTNDPQTYCEDDPVADEAGFLFCNGVYDDAAGEVAEYGPVGEEALQNIDEGTPVSYVDEGLASSYYFPKTQLDELGIETHDQFAGGQAESVLEVYTGQTTVGTSGVDARRQLLEDMPDVAQEVVVFAWAGPIPNHSIVASENLTKNEQQMVTEAFLAFAGAGDLEEGDPLAEVYGIQGLVEPDEEALKVAREVYDNFGD